MILSVTTAEHVSDFKVRLEFNDGYQCVVDLKSTIFSDARPIFRPLRDPEYFNRFQVRLNTICWDNEADFAPEFLRGLPNLAASEHVDSLRRQ
jgi:hypothetical protein